MKNLEYRLAHRQEEQGAEELHIKQSIEKQFADEENTELTQIAQEEAQLNKDRADRIRQAQEAWQELHTPIEVLLPQLQVEQKFLALARSLRARSAKWKQTNDLCDFLFEDNFNVSLRGRKMLSVVDERKGRIVGEYAPYNGTYDLGIPKQLADIIIAEIYPTTGFYDGDHHFYLETKFNYAYWQQMKDMTRIIRRPCYMNEHVEPFHVEFELPIKSLPKALKEFDDTIVDFFDSCVGVNIDKNIAQKLTSPPVPEPPSW